MAKKRHTPERIVTLLRQMEVAVANGKTTPQACQEAEITEQTYYRWRNESGGRKLDQAWRRKELQKENLRLQRLVAELSLEKQVLQTIAAPNLFQQLVEGVVARNLAPALRGEKPAEALECVPLRVP